VTAYNGRPIDLPDSTRVDIGAMVCELHCNNGALLNFSRKGCDIYTAGRSELKAIADWVIQSDIYVEAIFGMTLLCAAAERLGFHLRKLPPSRRARADRLFMNGMLALYSIDGVARLRRGHILDALPREIWMSRAELLRRYGSPRPASLDDAITKRTVAEDLP
jgi:YkoP domain